MIGLGAGRAAGAAAAVPREWEVTVIIGTELVADAGWPGRAAVTVVGVLALVVRTASAAARLHDVVAVRVERWHYPYIVVVHQPMGVRVVIVAIEEVADVAHRYLRHRYLAGVDGPVEPEDRFGAGNSLICDVQRPDVIAGVW